MLCFIERIQMGKSFQRNQQYRPKKQGRVFTKDQSWKKHKKAPPINPEIIDPADLEIKLPEQDNS